MASSGFWLAKNVGETNFAVFFDEKLIYESQIVVRRKQDATVCRVNGEGLKRAIVGVPANFQVDMNVLFIVRFLPFTLIKVFSFSN